MIMISTKNKKLKLLLVSINHSKKKNCMKKYSFIIALFVLVFSFFSCFEEVDEKKEMGEWDSGPITEYTVTPINGGATIEYSIPEDHDIMYIMAEYERNGTVYTEKASVHKNMLTIDGFHRTDVVKAKIYKVNKDEQRSKPISIEFEPLESLLDIAFKTLKLSTGFGGVL